MKCSIVIATYGEEDPWVALALERAAPSTTDQGAYEVLVGHDSDGTLASVRNELAAKAGGDWLMFLDADDSLAPGFIAAMKMGYAREREYRREPFLLAPATSFVVRGRKRVAHFSREIPLRDGNPLIIGTLVPRSRFLEVGGFREWPIFEDWDLWARCDVPIVRVPDAVYLAHVSTTSRNRVNGVKTRNYWHQMIGHDIWPEYYDAPTKDEHERRQLRNVRKLQAA